MHAPVAVDELRRRKVHARRDERTSLRLGVSVRHDEVTRVLVRVHHRLVDV